MGSIARFILLLITTLPKQLPRSNLQFIRVEQKRLGMMLRVSAEFALFLWILFVPVRHGSFESREGEIVTIDVYSAKHLVRSGHRYLDVRTEEEFKRGHVDVGNPLNVPYMFNTPEGRVKNPEFMEQVMSLCNKDDKLVVGCQSGVRSVYATTDLLKAGFNDVRNMGGGYLAWVDNGFSVKKPQAEDEDNDKISSYGEL